MEIFGVSGGNSSIEINRTAKGDLTYSLKLYFIGHDMRIIKQVIENILKGKRIIEVSSGQEAIPTEEMSSYMRSLTEKLDATVKSKEEAKASEKP